MTSRSLLLNMFIAACMIASTRPSLAQDPPVEFGEIPAEDLRMTVCPIDSTADAFILADYGQAYINDDVGVDYERILRVKIFRKSAFDAWGTHVIGLYTRNSYAHLRKLEGATYSLGSDGSVVRTELSDDGIFKEKADAEITRFRLTMPALTPGCIIEFRYRVRYNDASMPDWRFQHDVPCRWSEYRVTYPKQMMFAIVTTTFIPFTIDLHTETTRRYGGETAMFIGSGGDLAKCQFYRLAMANLPALKEEPYVTSIEDYVPRVQIQLAAYARPDGGGVEKVMRTWDKVVEELLDRKDFGKLLKPDGTLRDLSAKIAGPFATKAGKMKALYDYVRSSVVWNGKYRFLSTEDPDDVLSAKRGTSADVNFLLMALLRAADIETYPVLVSTRSNGKIVDVYSLVDQFNHVIAQATVDGTVYYLDATDADRPLTMLPEELLNVRGLIFKEGPVQWVTLTSPLRATHRAQATVTLNAAGEISGSLQSMDEQYSALNRRHAMKDKKPLEFARTTFDAAATGLTIDSAWIAGQDSIEMPLRIDARITPSPYAQANGDMLYVNPSVIDRLTENPFKRQTRSFPVDMAYGRSSTTVSVITAPEGFEVKDIPTAVIARVGASDAAYSRMSTQDGNTVTTIERTAINVPEFQPKAYASLKEFYDKIVSSDASLIVLKRKPAPPAEPEKKPPKTAKVKR